MSLPSADELLTLLLTGLIFGVFAAFWSLLMAVLVAPRTVIRHLRKRLEHINDPADPFASTVRKSAGSIFGMAMQQVGSNPQILSPVVGAFWQNIRTRAIGAKGGASTIVPEDMLSVAMEEGPEAIAGIAEMFGVSGRAAKAFGRMATGYMARRMTGEGNGGAGPFALSQGEGGKDWWEWG